MTGVKPINRGDLITKCTRKVEASIPVNVAASRYTVNVNPQIHAPLANCWPRTYHHVDTEIEKWKSKAARSASLLIVIEQET